MFSFKLILWMRGKTTDVLLIDQPSNKKSNCKSSQLKQVKLRDLLVLLDLAPNLSLAEKLVSEGRVRVRGSVATSAKMKVSAVESDVVLGPRQQAGAQHEPSPSKLASTSTSKDIKEVHKLSMLSLGALLHKRLGISLQDPERLISAGIIFINGEPVKDPSMTVNNEVDILIPAIPAWRWLSIIEELPEEDAKVAIRAHKVGTNGGLIVTPDEILTPALGTSLKSFSSSSHAALKTSSSDFTSQVALSIKSCPVTLADALVQKRLARSFAHARWLCETGRVNVDGKIERDPSAELPAKQVLNVGSKIPEQPRSKLEEDMREFVKKLAAFAASMEVRSNYPLPVRQFIKEHHVAEEFVTKALAEFGPEFGVVWSSKLGLCCRIRPARGDPARRSANGDRHQPRAENTLDAEQCNLCDNEGDDTLHGKSINSETQEVLENVTASIEEAEPAHAHRSASPSFEVSNASILLEMVPLSRALLETNLAADEEDAKQLLAQGAVLVDGTVAYDTAALVVPNAVDLINNVKLMRRAVPRAATDSVDAFHWPRPEQKELIWVLAATSCFICNVALEALACGVVVDAAGAMSLFLSDGRVHMPMLRVPSRLIIERACHEAISRWTEPQSPGYLYRRKMRRPQELILTHSSEYFWPLVGMYSDSSKIQESVEAFYGTEQDERKRKRLLSVLLDLTMYVTDDFLLLSDRNRSYSTQQHVDRLRKLSQVRGLADSPWHTAFQALYS
jgi:ribosomal protein S4